MGHEGQVSSAPRRIERPVGAPVLFSVCTLVTKTALYQIMCESFRSHGFDGEDVEFLYVDNSAGNVLDAYEGLNRMISHAQGRYLILCHQDVLLIEDGRDVLLARLKELDALDPGWALAGNAGVLGLRERAIHLTDGTSEHNSHRFPQRVNSLDENFIVLKSESQLGFSRDLHGFHFYGADICLQAEVRGWRAYVIDFHLRHDSLGTMDQAFVQARTALEEKYGNFMLSRQFGTTCTTVSLAPPKPKKAFARARSTARWYRRYIWKTMRGKPPPPRE